MLQIRIVFWCHFIVCALAHILGPLCLIATIRWCLGNSKLDFWDMCLVMGANYMGMVYVANHVASNQSFCSLTALEQQLRKVNKLPSCGDSFLPRFYAKCRQISRGHFFKIPL